jgi:hypothetical protein
MSTAYKAGSNPNTRALQPTVPQCIENQANGCGDGPRMTRQDRNGLCREGEARHAPIKDRAIARFEEISKNIK